MDKRLYTVEFGKLLVFLSPTIGIAPLELRNCHDKIFPNVTQSFWQGHAKRAWSHGQYQLS